MVIVQARIPVVSEKRELAYRHVRVFVKTTRSEEGCMRCDAFADIDDPDTILIQQTWRDSTDLDRHAEGRCLDSFLDAMPEFVDGQVQTTRFETAPGHGEPLEPVEQVEPEAVVMPQGVTLH